MDFRRDDKSRACWERSLDTLGLGRTFFGFSVIFRLVIDKLLYTSCRAFPAEQVNLFLY